MPGYQYLIGLGVGVIAALYLYISNRNRLTHTDTNSPTYPRTSKECTSSDFISTPNDPCPICMYPMDNNTIQYLICGHGFHSKCWLDCLKRKMGKCPVCRIRVR